MADTNIVSVIIKAVDQTKGGFTMAINNAADFEKAVGKLAPAATAVAVTVAAAFAGMSVHAVNAMDEMAKAAAQTSESVEELSALKYAADQSGVAFEGLQAGLKAFSKNIVTASAGNNELSKAFADLGISVSNADGSLRGQREIMGDIANRFAGAADGAEKTAMAMAIFGKQGADLIPLLNQGNRGIRELEDRAAALGQTFTQEAAAGAETWNDSLSDLLKSLQGVVNVVVSEFIPTLAASAKGLTDWIVRTQAVEIAGRTIVGVIRDLSAGFSMVYAAASIMAQTLAVPVAAALAVLDGLVRGVTNQIVHWALGIENVVKAAVELVRTVEDLGTVLGLMWEGDIAAASVEASQAVDRYEARLKALGDTTKDLFKGAAEVARTDFAQTFDGLAIGFNNSVGQIKTTAFNLFGYLDNLYSKLPTPPAGGDAPKGDLLGSRVTGEGKLVKPTGRDEETEALKQREADLETLRQLHLDMRQEQLDGFALILEQENQQHAERLRKIEELKLTTDERREAEAAAVKAHSGKVIKINADMAKAEKASLDMKLSYAAHILGQSAALAQQFGKKGFLAYQALAIGQTIISTAQAVMRAYADLGPIGGSVAAPFISALGGVQVGLIAAQKPPAAHGGLDYVPRESTYLLERGERVLSPNQNAELIQFMRDQGNGGGGSYEINVSLDGNTVGRTLFEMTRDGRLRIDSRAVRT